MKGSIFFLSILCTYIFVDAAEALPTPAGAVQAYQVEAEMVGGHPVTAISVNKHSRQIAACCDGAQIEPRKGKLVNECVFIWNSKTSKLQHILHNNSGSVTALHWHPRQELPYLATGSKDKTINILDPSVSWGKHKKSLSHSTMGQVHSIAWHPSEANLVSASDDGLSAQERHVLRIWEPFSWGNKVRSMLTGHTDTINDVAWNSVGDRIVSGADDGQVQFWDSQQGISRRKLKEEQISIRSLDWLDPYCFVTGALALSVWDSRMNPSRVGSLSADTGFIRSVRVRPDPFFSYALISATEDGAVQLWDLRVLSGVDDWEKHSARACLEVLQERRGRATSVDSVSCQNTHTFAYGSSDGKIRIITKPVSNVTSRIQQIRNSIEEENRRNAQQQEERNAKRKARLEGEKQFVREVTSTVGPRAGRWLLQFLT